MNVESVAVRHGIKVDTASIADADEYASAVKVVADGVEVGATLFGSMQRPRIMSLLDYKIDIAPAKQSLVFEYVDAPGRIGAIGTLLGNEGVNHHDDADRHEALREDGARVHERRGQCERPAAREALGRA